MNHDRFLGEVMRRAGFQQPAMANLAIDATLEAVGQRLTYKEAHLLAEQLPVAMRSALLRGPHGDDFDLAELYRRVSRREGVRLGFALEHAQVVCQVLAETIDAGMRGRLHQLLPRPLAELFTPRPPVQAGPPPHRHHGLHGPTGRTLATGRPGSRHTV